MAARKHQAKLLSGRPASLGYRMPAEWRKHFATLLAFPHHKSDWPKKLNALPHTFAEMARIITQGERVRLLVRDHRQRDRAAKVFECAGVKMESVDFVLQATNRSWLRDTMPLWVTRSSAKGKAPPKSNRQGPTRRSDRVAVNFRFNGWARYRDHLLDDEAGLRIAEEFSPKQHLPRDEEGRRIVLEGGSVDVDDVGTLLTTSECLMNSARARFSGQKSEVEAVLEETLGVKKVLWLPQGIVGDDTSGHIDDFARFAPKGRVLLCHESRRSDPNYLPLRRAQKALSGSTDARGRRLEIVSLPMPAPVEYDGERLPASYANFYISNAAVLVPVFNDPQDLEALSIIKECFPDRSTVGVYARDLVVGLGTLHCSTMQEPF